MQRSGIVYPLVGLFETARLGPTSQGDATSVGPIVGLAGVQRHGYIENAPAWRTGDKLRPTNSSSTDARYHNGYHTQSYPIQPIRSLR